MSRNPAARRPLPELAIEIAAHPGLIHQVISAVGQSSAGHGSRLLEHPEPNRMIVEFTTRLLGRTIRTEEEVTLEPPGRIHYRLLRGPLPEVEEDFAIEGAGSPSTLRYTGWYQPHPGRLRGWLDRAVVPAAYRRAVWTSMRQVKQLSEARQSRSRLFPI